MKPIAVGIVGYNRIGKRVVDAIARQPDLRLVGVIETDPKRIGVLQALKIPLDNGALLTGVMECQVVVHCDGTHLTPSVPCVYGPDMPVSLPLFGVAQPQLVQHCRVPCADALAFSRLLSSLPPVERLFSSCARRCGAATDHRFARVDALEPMFEELDDDKDIRALLGSPVSVSIRRTRLPYTQSHLHHVKLDLKSSLSREDALTALNSAPRCRVAQGAARFINTGQLQEFDRDLGRPRGDRPEVFVWEESVATIDRCLFLTIDVSPDATPVPDIIDAVRQLAFPEVSLAKAKQLTNFYLGIKG